METLTLAQTNSDYNLPHQNSEMFLQPWINSDVRKLVNNTEPHEGDRII